MLDYIRKQLQSKAGLEEEPVQEAQMDEAILECAHLFQEMENLTMDGQASARSFSRMSIPLEDDIEVTSLELNMLDGRVTNIPGDATVQEQVEEEPYKYGDYSRMKTRSEFYTEAYSSLTQFPRETDDEFANRVEAKASKLFREYKEYIIQEGLFGNDLIKVTDSRVPPRITVDFGECEGKPYYVKMPVLFQVDRKDRITKKQLDTAYIIRDADTLGHGIREAAYKIWGEKVSCDSINKIWKFVTPTRILIPRDPVDKYVAYFEFEIDGESKPDYISMSIPVSKSVKNVKNIKADDFARVTDKKGIAGSDMVSKLDAVRMEEALMKKPKASRFFQEEIDFGDPNAAPDSDPNATDVSVDTGATATPSIDGGSAPAADGAPADGLDATAAPADTNAENKELVATNDVSGDIAEKISDETSSDSDINTDDVNLDATTSSDVSDDLGATDEPSEADLQADLGTDTSATDEDTSSTEMSDMDFDNMTVDELLAQGTDKLKGMTIQQLKDFLGSPDGTSPTDVGEGVQEAFFLTRGNIGKELDIHLRKALGILNDNEMEIEDLCDAFRKEGKQCNRVVHKASKMPKVFNEAEIKQLLRLNHCLSDLMAMMRADVKKSELMTVKRMIQAFVSEASGVLKMLETRNKHKEDETVQEAYYPCNPDKVKSHYAEVESIIGRPLPDGYKRIIEYGIDNIGIKGADRWFQGCMWEITGDLKDRDKFDYDGHPGSEFIPLANNGRGDEILMGNTSKTDTRIFTYIHDVKNGLKQIAENWDEFEDLLYTRKESDAKYDTMKMKFFGKECPVRIPRGISIKDTCTSIDFANKCDKLLNDSVRKEIRDIMEKCKGDFSDEELKSADWKHPEKHMKPAYIYVNDHIPRAPRTDGRYDWKIMLDCDWDFDEEHGLAIMFDENMKFKAVGQPGSYM